MKKVGRADRYAPRSSTNQRMLQEYPSILDFTPNHSSSFGRMAEILQLNDVCCNLLDSPRTTPSNTDSLFFSTTNQRENVMKLCKL